MMPRALRCMLPACLILAATAACAGEPRALQTDLPVDFIPEGVAWDAPRGRYLMGSVHLRRIAAIDADSGTSSPFATDLDSVLGLHVSPDGSQLWAAATSLPQGDAPVAPGRTGLWVFDLASGKPVARHALPGGEARANLGDFVFVDAQTILASDSGTGAIWAFDIDATRWTPLLPAGTFRSPQGLAPGRQPGNVYLADYSTGIWRISTDGEREHLPAPQGSEVRGIDGLYRDGDRLVAIQNGTRVHRILLLRLAAVEERIVSVDALAEGLPGWEEPTLGQIVCDRVVYVGNSQWFKFDAEGRLPPGTALSAPRIESLPLPKD